MITTLSTKGQTVIPERIREQARLKAGDKLDVGVHQRLGDIAQTGAVDGSASAGFNSVWP
jgi:AbrB family looped-hinge helix DNA binding protein